MEHSATPRVEVRVLGGFEVAVDGRPVERTAWQRVSAERLVKLLAVSPGRTVDRERAAETLWPDTTPALGRANLRKALHFARRVLPDACLEADNAHLRLRGVDVDLDRLSQALECLDHGTGTLGGDDRGSALAVVLADGHRTLLPDDLYEDWLVSPRERLQSRWLVVAMEVAQRAAAAGRTAEAHALAEQMLDRDPADEAAHRLAIELYTAEGRHHAARRQFEMCRRALRDGLGVDPLPETGEALRRGGPSTWVAAGRPTTRLVGRAREMERIEPLLDQVAAGRAAVLVMRGAAGIGKTRLLEEVREYARASSWRVLAWDATGPARAVAFAPFAIGLRAVLDGLEPETWEEPARSALATVAPSLGIVPRLSFAERGALVMALLEALGRLARDRPALLAVDDATLIDDASADVLAGLPTALRESPVLLALTARDDEPMAEPIQRLLEHLVHDGATELEVGPLKERDIEPLLVGHLGGAFVAPEVSRLLFARSAGNPLFCLGLARDAQTQGLLRQTHERWTTAPGASGFEDAPASVRQLVAARSAGLSRRASELLRVAAMLGPAFSYGALSTVLADVEGGLLAALDDALASGLLREHGTGYAFAHPLYRAAVETNAGPARRGRLHLRIAEALAGLPVSDSAGLLTARGHPDPIPIAEHSLRAVELGVAEARPMAVAFGFAAGMRASVLFDRATATRLLERSVSEWERLAPAARSEHDAAAALGALAEIRMTGGDEAAADVTFRRAAEAARTPDELGAVYERHSWLPYRHGDFAAGAAIAEEGLARLPDDASRARALVGSQHAWCLARLHRLDEALAEMEECRTALAGASVSVELSLVEDRLGMLLSLAGRDAEGLVALEAALAASLACGDARSELVRIHLAAVLTRMGRPEEARPHAVRAIELAHQMGDGYMEAVALWIAAEMEDARGDLDRASSFRQRELALLSRLGGNAHNEALAHAHLAHLARRRGDADMAEREAATAQELADRDSEPGYGARIAAAIAVRSWAELRTG